VAAPIAGAPASRKKLVIVVSLATFACCALAAVAYDRLRSPARAERIAPIARSLPQLTPTPAPPAPTSPTMIVAPVGDPEPAVSPARPASPPVDGASHGTQRPAQPKARPATRSPVARAARPRRPAAPAAAQAAATEAAPATPATARRPTKKWVDPFAD
jgi:hypothetical protein